MGPRGSGRCPLAVSRVVPAVSSSPSALGLVSGDWGAVVAVPGFGAGRRGYCVLSRLGQAKAAQHGGY